VLCLLLAATVITIYFGSRLRPIVESIAAYQVRVFAARIVNEALLGELERMNLEYEDLVKITQREDGTVTSIQTNMVNINRLKTQASQSVIRSLDSGLSQHSIRVPLGTMFGNEFLAGRGPPIEIRILPIGYIQAETYNEFLTAGINQTMHHIVLRIDIRMTAVLPGYSVTTDTVTNFSIAETIIVGDIPESFTQVFGDGAPLISKINDYAAGR